MSRHVIVTGAFGALGRVVVEAFVEAGYGVALVDIGPAPADVASWAGEGLVLPGSDISDPQIALEVVGKVVAEFGGVDVLVNIAGGFAYETVGGGHVSTWERMWTMNVMTAANMCRAAFPAIQASERGRIVNVGAGAAIKAGAGMAPYAAAKSGVHRLTEALAEELRGKATVNAVLPSIIDTPQNRRDMPGADVSAWVRPTDLAAVIVFLASDAARAVTGALVPVTGGA